MPDWLKEWWPAIAVAMPLVLAAAGWAIRRGLPSRDEFLKGLQAEATARAQGLVAEAAARAQVLRELDERLSKAVAAIDKKVLEIEAEIRHLPTSEDFAELKTQMVRVETVAENTSREIDGIRLALTRIEDYLLKQERKS